MAGSSRAVRSIKNVQIALFFYVVNLILQFFSRKIFLNYLGAEILGLNSTAQNLIGFLNLAELGIGSAIAFTLYKPIYQRDIQSINEIVTIQGWFYRKVAGIIIIAACTLMYFFPMIFAKTQLSLWYAYSSFIVLLISALLSYYVNYKQIVLVADQKEYKVTLCVQGGKVLKVILQIIAILFLANGYLFWLAIELLMSFVIAYFLNLTIRKEYPWLVISIVEGKRLNKKYPQIIKKTKQLFIHQISAFALSQTSPLIIFAYTSLTLVAIYGNYMLIISGILLLVKSLFRGMSAGIGSLVAEANKNKIKSFYWECVAVHFWTASVLCFGLFMLTRSFIILWIGEEYVLSQSSLYLLLIYTFLVITRASDYFISAYGLFQDVWAALVEAILNIGCSIFFGFYWGLNGIILGVVLSLFLVIFCWKPYFLFKYGFRESIKEYILKCVKYMLLIALSFIFSYYSYHYFFSIEVNHFIWWIIKMCLCMGIYIVISIPLFLLFDLNLRHFFSRIILFFRRKK